MTFRGRTRRTVVALAFALGSAGGGLVPSVGAASVSAVEEDPSFSSLARRFGVVATEDAASDVTITMSFFRYCLGDVCTHDQFGYVRARASGPTLPPHADNPRGIIDVRPGDRITWTYNDPFCDFHDGDGGGPSPISCPGHVVIFEDGSVTSPLMRARTTPAETFSWTVPDTQTPGTKIPYYCAPGVPHYQSGMTGILRIV